MLLQTQMPQCPAATQRLAPFTRNQSHFQVELKAGILTSAPASELSYFEWHVTTDPMETDGGKEDCSHGDDLPFLTQFDIPRETPQHQALR